MDNTTRAYAFIEHYEYDVQTCIFNTLLRVNYCAFYEHDKLVLHHAVAAMKSAKKFIEQMQYAISEKDTQYVKASDMFFECLTMALDLDTDASDAHILDTAIIFFKQTVEAEDKEQLVYTELL